MYVHVVVVGLVLVVTLDALRHEGGLTIIMTISIYEQHNNYYHMYMCVYIYIYIILHIYVYICIERDITVCTFNITYIPY